MQSNIRGLIDEIFKLPIPRHVSRLGHVAHSNDNASTSMRASSFFLELTPFRRRPFALRRGNRRHQPFTAGVIDANGVNLHIILKTFLKICPSYVTKSTHLSSTLNWRSLSCQTRYLNLNYSKTIDCFFCRRRFTILVARWLKKMHQYFAYRCAIHGRYRVFSTGADTYTRRRVYYRYCRSMCNVVLNLFLHRTCTTWNVIR